MMYIRGGFLVSMLHRRESHITVALCMVSIKDFSYLSTFFVFRSLFKTKNPGNIGMNSQIEDSAYVIHIKRLAHALDMWTIHKSCALPNYLFQHSVVQN